MCDRDKDRGDDDDDDDNDIYYDEMYVRVSRKIITSQFRAERRRLEVSLMKWPSDDDDDIYIMMHVCLFVTKNDHFLLGVSCDHLNPP